MSFGILFWYPNPQYIKATFMKRPRKKNIYIICMILVIFVNFWPVQGDMVIEFMYVKRMFQWKMDRYSYFSTVANAVSNAGTLVSLPIFHYFNASDNSIILISGLSGLLIRLCKGLVKTEEGFFAASFFGLLVSVFYAPVRAQITRCVSSEELGKVKCT